jgi:hypothetical protein
MTKKELQYVKKLLELIKTRDEYILKAIAYVDKDLAQYEARRGQLKDSYEVESFGGW